MSYENILVSPKISKTFLITLCEMFKNSRIFCRLNKTWQIFQYVKHGEIEPNLIPMKHWFPVHPLSFLQNMMNDSQFTGHYKTCNSWWSQVWCNTPSLTPQWIPFLTHHRTAVALLLTLPARCTAVYRQAAASAGGHCRPGNPCKKSYSFYCRALMHLHIASIKCY